MTALQLLSELREQGIQLWVENGNLRLRAPLGTLTDELRHTLAEHKQGILTFLEQIEVGPQGAAGPPLKALPRNGTFPLSFAQQRLWFLQQLTPNSTAYHVRLQYRVTGSLNVWALGRSLNEIVRRHESLRTTFAAVEGSAVQVIAPPNESQQPLVDLSGLSEVERESQTRLWGRLEADRPFDLHKGPLLRSTLLKLGTREHLWLFNMHHIISDGWSLGVFSREFMTLYESFSTGNPARLPELPVQYADFAVWQRQQLQGEPLDRHLQYWRQQLAGMPALLDLPTDRPRTAGTRQRAGIERITFSGDLADGLRHLAHETGSTLFMTLLAAFQVLLARHSGQTDIVVGSPIAGRTRPEIEGLIGFFVNTLVMRSDLSGNPTFREFLAQVRRTTLDGYAHQDIPFEHLVAQLRPDRNLSHSPLFQAMFVLQNAPREVMSLAGVTMETMPVSSDTAKFDLTLTLSETPPGISGSVNYNTDLFDASTIRRVIGHFEVLLEGIVRDPDRGVLFLPLMTAAEERQLLVEWNDTSARYPSAGCIHGLFEEQVERAPEATAVVFEDQQITYRELNTRANQLGHYLRTLGVGPDVLVGVLMERSVEMVIALLGILKAGGAYVPLDPAYPKDRLAFMIQDTCLGVLVTHSRLEDRFSDQKPAFSIQHSELELHCSPINFKYSAPAPYCLCLDQHSSAIAKQRSDNPVNRTDPLNLAYVIYTSGSTGTPKGVMIHQRSLVNHMQWMLRRWNCAGENRVLQKTPLSFDASGWEFYAPLLSGGVLIIARPDGHGDPSYLSRVIVDYEVTTLQVVPSLLRLLVEEPALRGSNSLKFIFSGGEPLPRELIERCYDCLNAELHNLYGPTEACIDASHWACVRGDQRVMPSIGRPIHNTCIHVLETHLALVPIGVAGELYIAGDGLARGYLGRGGLTAERFIPDLYSKGPGARLYRTGDLARYFPDGNLEFLGRLDHQVKIRGFRIELGEIEAVLGQHPAVRDAVVVARSAVTADWRPDTTAGPGRATQHPTPNTHYLIAYVVSEPETSASISELRAYVGRKLPDYMVPQYFVTLDDLPLTPNGKVDREALPEPEGIRPDLEKAYVEPRTATEELLAGIWCEILGLDGIGVHDNFFELGGHSLLATQVVSRVHAAFSVAIPLRALFEAPTIEGLAECVDNAVGNELSLRAHPLVAVPREGDLPLSYAQQRLWFLHQFEPNDSTYNVPQAMRLRGCLDRSALARSFHELIQRHESLRTTFPDRQGQAVQHIIGTVPSPLRVVALGDLPAKIREMESRRLIRGEAVRSFDLVHGPLFRVLLVELASAEHILLTSMHHIVSDGWSVGIVTREIRLLYEAFAHGRSSPLADLPVQYADFAVWQRHWLQGEVLQQQLDYWGGQLHGIPKLLELATDRARPAVQTHRGSSEALALSSALSQKLRALSRGAGSTLFMTLLAAFQVLLARHTGQTDIVVGSPIAGRTRPEIEGLIGFFVNTLVMRSDLSGNPTFRELLNQVRQTCLDAYAHQDVPFEQLVEELHPQRDLGHTPLFQIMFVLQNAPREAMSLSGVTMETMPVRFDTAKFDLTLSLSEIPSGIGGSVNYNTDLFDASTVQRMLGHFEVLLGGIVGDPDQRVSDLPLLTTAERERLLVEWNDTSTEYPSEKSIPVLFEAQVERTPDAVAVVFPSAVSGQGGEEQLTYRELNQRANQLGHYLRGLGVRSEVLVGIMVERSVAMVVGLLGILKAGGAYVPLDPTYPSERLRFMIRDAGISVLLTQEGILGQQAMGNRQFPTLVLLDDPGIARAPTHNPGAGVSSENVAYMDYTSGSTGQPKGVLVTHRGVSRLLLGVDYVYLDETVRCLHLSPISFDASTFEVWGPLLHGGCCVLYPERVPTPQVLGETLSRYEVNTLWLTASFFNLVMDEGPEVLGGVEQLLIGGEALSVGHVGRGLKHLPATRIINGYGPTEGTTFTCCYGIPQELDVRVSSIAIGRPIANTQVYLLDGQLEPLPIGVAGELHIGGDGVARGYSGHGELTAERFVPHAYGAEAGGRLYKTGDLSRYRADGNIEFLGRMDQQVKIRGFRIEPGEIEALLGQHPAVRDAVVVARSAMTGERRSDTTAGPGRATQHPTPNTHYLIAYVVSEPETSASVGDLRAFLGKQLPDYMVPQYFVTLDDVPLTPNGKVDREALPEPKGLRPDLEKAYVEPRTATEKRLVEIWSKLLGLEQVGVHDNFFELGGHSLLATQVISRVRQTFAVDLPLRILFERPTIAGLAESINTMCWMAEGTGGDLQSSDDIEETTF